jgi:pimeloyl-ACP methyl ester carboxylesterase
MAYARQASLLHHDLGTPVLPEVGPDDDLVIGLHGLFATGGVMRPLRARLEAQGVATAAMSYAPGLGVAALADRLGEWLGEVDARIHLIGHSLGGIVARYYSQAAGDRRVVQTISLASPFAGVKIGGAGWLGSSLQLYRDLSENSALLRELRLSRGVPHLSIVAADDSLIPASFSHALPGGEVVVLDQAGHNALLFDARVVDHVTRRVVDSRQRRTSRI